MVLSELSYKPKLGGGSHGTMMLHVGIGGEEISPLHMEVIDIVNRLEEASVMMQMKVKNVLVTPDKNSSTEDVTKLLMMLNDRKFNVGLILTGFSIPIYAREAKFIQAVIATPKWDNFRVSELVYQPYDSDFIEPEILENNYMCNKYLKLNKKSDPSRAINFINQARFIWGLIVPPSKEISVNFLEDKHE